MAYKEAKVYYDGSHYVGIPHTTRKTKPRAAPIEETVAVTEELTPAKEPEIDYEALGFEVVEMDEKIFEEPEPTNDKNEAQSAEKQAKTACYLTRKELFNEWYRKTENMKYKARYLALYGAMRPFFKSDEETQKFLSVHFARKRRNLIMRRIRMSRKAALQEFNYFCTFTYDSALHTEESFKKQLKTCFRHLCNRKKWKYIGVWERSPEKKRLHFHGIFYIPPDAMPETCIERRDYSFHTHQREIIHQNTYFLRRFGRNDMEPIEDKSRMGEALAYLMKYIDKTGEKIVYSKGLPQYFISDILDCDVACIMENGDRPIKLVLHDNFMCFDEGVYVGDVSPETIAKLRKCN